MKNKVIIFTSLLCCLVLLRGFYCLDMQLLQAQESDEQARQEDYYFEKSWQEPLYDLCHKEQLPSSIEFTDFSTYSLDNYHVEFTCHKLTDIDLISTLPFINYLDDTFHTTLADFIHSSANSPYASKAYSFNNIVAVLTFPDQHTASDDFICNLRLFVFPHLDYAPDEVKLLQSFPTDDFIIRRPMINDNQKIMMLDTPSYLFGGLRSIDTAPPVGLSYELYTKDNKLTRIKLVIGYNDVSDISSSCFTPLQQLVSNTWSCSQQDLETLITLQEAIIAQKHTKGSGHTPSFKYHYHFSDSLFDSDNRYQHFIECTFYQ